MENSSWIVLALVFLLSVLVGAIFRRLGQLSFVGYVLVGIFSKYLFSYLGIEWLKEWSELASVGGVLLLFLIGLEMKISDVGSVGKILLLIFLLQTGLLVVVVYPLMRLMDLDPVSSLLISLSLTFSSTILVVKILSEKKVLSGLIGRLSVGMLLLQDLLAIVLMTILANGSLTVVARGSLIGLVFVILGSKLVLGAFKVLIRSTEEVVLFSLGWCLAIASFFASSWLGLSPEVGGFVAGLTLSSTFENHHIVSKVKPLRDFFVVIFFLALGFQVKVVTFTLLGGIGLGLLLVLLKFGLTLLLTRIFGLANRVAFEVSLGLSSASEFTLILMSGFLISGEVKAVLMVSVISSMIIGSFLLMTSDKLFGFFGRSLPWWGGRSKALGDTEGTIWPSTRFVLLIGGHRMGKSVLSALESQDKELVVLDYDPEVVSKLKAEGIRAYFADISDREVLGEIPFGRIDLVISTIPNSTDNLELVSYINKKKFKVKVVVDAENFEDSEVLYKAGVDYVVFPHFVGGMHLAEILADESSGTLEKYKVRQSKMLAKIYNKS